MPFMKTKNANASIHYVNAIIVTSGGGKKYNAQRKSIIALIAITLAILLTCAIGNMGFLQIISIEENPQLVSVMSTLMHLIKPVPFTASLSSLNGDHGSIPLTSLRSSPGNPSGSMQWFVK